MKTAKDIFREDKNSVNKGSIFRFLLLTMGIASIAFLLMLDEPAYHSPEGFPAILIWLLAIWSPTIAAIVVAMRRGNLTQLLSQSFCIPRNPIMLSLVLLPLICLISLVSFLSFSWPEFLGFPQILLLVGINLLMGPLGEELGWRGFLYPALRNRLGWLGAAVVVGLIWGFWHGPLWFIASPQSEIPFEIFLGNVMVFSILMAILRDTTGPSLLGPVSLHLTINVAAGLFALMEMGTQADYWSFSLVFLGAVAMISVIVYQFTERPHCGVPVSK
ncbi:MAG: type II CAAX endopeptidase family protein [Leptospiraceae bacterium]